MASLQVVPFDEKKLIQRMEGKLLRGVSGPDIARALLRQELKKVVGGAVLVERALSAAGYETLLVVPTRCSPFYSLYVTKFCGCLLPKLNNGEVREETDFDSSELVRDFNTIQCVVQ